MLFFPSISLNIRSHPTWVRGLKLSFDKVGSSLPAVAPYVGAWIETKGQALRKVLLGVAPYVGAWIETIGSRLP